MMLNPDITNFIASVCAEALAGGLIACAWCAAALLLEVALCMDLVWFSRIIPYPLQDLNI